MLRALPLLDGDLRPRELLDLPRVAVALRGELPPLLADEEVCSDFVAVDPLDDPEDASSRAEEPFGVCAEEPFDVPRALVVAIFLNLRSGNARTVRFVLLRRALQLQLPACGRVLT